MMVVDESGLARTSPSLDDDIDASVIGDDLRGCPFGMPQESQRNLGRSDAEIVQHEPIDAVWQKRALDVQASGKTICAQAE